MVTGKPFGSYAGIVRLASAEADVLITASKPSQPGAACTRERTRRSVYIRTDNPDTCGVHILDAPFKHRVGPEETVARIKAVVGARPCYVTFDIDCLDPAFAPGTGTPVWGAWPAGRRRPSCAGWRG